MPRAARRSDVSSALVATLVATLLCAALAACGGPESELDESGENFTSANATLM